MKLNEIKEVGFYHEVNDLERKIIYGIMENADEDWLKEDPEATLLIDTWHYEYKDENDRDRYSVDGNLLTLYLNESDIDVVKIEDTKYKVFGEMGQFLIEDKPTYKEQLQRKTVECEELKEDNEELNKRNNFLLQRLEVDDTETSLVFKLQRELENSKSEFYCAIKSELKYKQALDEIAEHCEKVIKNLTTYDEVYDANISIEALHNISDIIDKVKGGVNNGYRK